MPPATRAAAELARRRARPERVADGRDRQRGHVWRGGRERRRDGRHGRGGRRVGGQRGHVRRKRRRNRQRGHDRAVVDVVEPRPAREPADRRRGRAGRRDAAAAPAMSDRRAVSAAGRGGAAPAARRAAAAGGAAAPRAAALPERAGPAARVESARRWAQPRSGDALDLHRDQPIACHFGRSARQLRCHRCARRRAAGNTIVQAEALRAMLGATATAAGATQRFSFTGQRPPARGRADPERARRNAGARSLLPGQRGRAAPAQRHRLRRRGEPVRHLHRGRLDGVRPDRSGIRRLGATAAPVFQLPGVRRELRRLG